MNGNSMSWRFWKEGNQIWDGRSTVGMQHRGVEKKKDLAAGRLAWISKPMATELISETIRKKQT
jgi:hypothetical protein